MVIRVGLLVVTRFVVVDYPIARNGSITLACRGIVPATVATVVAVVRVIPTFFNVVTRLVRRFRVFLITLALVVRMLGFCSLHVTGLKSLSFRVVGALRSPQESFFGTISIVPCTITRARRQRSFRVVAAPVSVVSVLLFITTMSLTTQFVVEPLLQFIAHLASGGLLNLVLFS